jgi:iron complex outermembrane receptor protein
MSVLRDVEALHNIAVRRIVAAALLSCLSALAITTVAAAQQAIELDEITVEGRGTEAVAGQGAEQATGPVQGIAADRSATGTKTSTPLIETPQSISVIGREQLDLLNPRSVLEAVRYSPSVADSAGGSDTRTDLYQIRGFNANPTGLFLDGLQLPSPNFAIFRLEPFGLERLEILRGPTSVLYGGASPGGLVNGVSKKPLWKPYAHVETGVNTFGNVYGAFDVSGQTTWGDPSKAAVRKSEPSVYDDFAYRIVGLGRFGDAYPDKTRDERAYIAPSFTWRPNDDTTLTVLGSYQKDRSNSLNFLPYEGTVTRAPFGRIPRKLFTGEPDRDTFKREQGMIGYELEHRFDDTFTFRQNARYAHLETRYDGIFGLGYVAPPTANSAVLFRSPFGENPKLDVGNVDNQVEARFNTGPLSHFALAGVEVRRISFLNRTDRGSADPLDLLDPDYGGNVVLTPRRRSKVERDQVGLYLQDQIKFDRISLTIGGRQDFVRTDFEDRLNSANDSKTKDEAFSARAGLSYRFDNGLAPYVSYSTSFEPQVGLNFGTDAVLKPEKGEQYEAGLKFQPNGFDGYASIAVFDLTKTDVAVSDPLGVVRQRGEVRSRGFEAEIVAKPVEGLSVIAAFTDFDNETTKDGDGSLIGKTPPGTIERLASLYLDYTFQTGALEGFGLGAGVRHVGRTWADDQNTLKVPAVTLADAGIHFRQKDKGWNASLTAQNLFDKRYVASCASDIFCFYGEGRRVTATVGYTW